MWDLGSGICDLGSGIWDPSLIQPQAIASQILYLFHNNVQLTLLPLLSLRDIIQMANLEVLELLINSVSKSKDELISIDQLKEKLVDVQENELTPFFVPTTLAIGGNNVAIHRIYVRRKNCPSDGVGWVFNDDVTVCAICSEEFGFMTWRHHCRACGNIVCDACSSQTATIVEFQDLDVQRVCKQCCTNEVSMVAASNTRENEDYVDENAVPEPEVVEEVVPVAEEAEAEKVSSEDHDEYTLEVPSRPEGNRGAVHRYSMRLSQVKLVVLYHVLDITVLLLVYDLHVCNWYYI